MACVYIVLGSCKESKSLRSDVFIHINSIQMVMMVVMIMMDDHDGRSWSWSWWWLLLWWRWRWYMVVKYVFGWCMMMTGITPLFLVASQDMPTTVIWFVIWVCLTIRYPQIPMFYHHVPILIAISLAPTILWHIIEFVVSFSIPFPFPLQLKGTCLPQKNCFSLDLVYYMVGIA